MAEQHASKLVSLSMIYDDLMTNPNKGTILHQLEEQFEDKFDAKLVLGCIFMVWTGAILCFLNNTRLGTCHNIVIPISILLSGSV